MVKAVVRIKRQLAYIETEQGQRAIIPKDTINKMQQKYRIQITQIIKEKS